MATTKKTAKKTVKNVTVPFNKKNTLELADLIFQDKGGVVSLLKLCNGDLSNGKDGGRTLHCAVGEAYFRFVNNDMRKVLKVEGEDGGDYEPTYGVTEGPTGAVIDALVEKAVLKKDTPANRSTLARALDSAVEENDGVGDSCSLDLGEFAERSRRVADVFRKKVAPLLK